jgi:hypothetical protein
MGTPANEEENKIKLSTIEPQKSQNKIGQF